MESVIGLDIGTTSVKAVLFTLDGNVLYEAESQLETLRPKPGWAEQDPTMIVEETTNVLSEVIAFSKVNNYGLRSIGFSSAMHSIICVDKNKNPLSKALIFSDARSQTQADEVKVNNGHQIYLKTGTPIHPMSPYIKLKWMKETAYQPYLKADYFMSIKEYILFKWFNQRVVDFGCASASGLFNLNNKNWDEDLLEDVSVAADKLSKIVPPTYLLDDWNDEMLEKLNTEERIPLIIGSADGHLSNLGDAAIEPGQVAISVGTSGAIRQYAQGYPVDESGETFTYAFDDMHSIVGGATNNGGIPLQWIAKVFNERDEYDKIIDEATDVDIGAEGLFFVPYVNGERAPLWNPNAKGTFYGLTVQHGRAHFIRAVLEGIALNIFQIGRTLEKVAGSPKRITVNGGLSKSKVWVQILADVFGQAIYLSETHHSAAWGAAWVSLVGIDKVSSVEDISNLKKDYEIVNPNKDNHLLYQKVYRNYLQVTKQQEPLYDSLN